MGDFTFKLNMKSIQGWKSKIFKVIDIQKYQINFDPDLAYWGYSDNLLERELPSLEHLKMNSRKRDSEGIDINIYVLNEPIQQNFFSRIINNNRVVVTYFQTIRQLEENVIPLENYLIMHLYFYSLIYLSKNDSEMTMDDEMRLIHNDSRGCLFDMCGHKEQFIHKSERPSLCLRCRSYLLSKGISQDVIETISKEFNNIKKPCYEYMLFFFKKHPIISFILSFFVAVLASIIANYLWCLF